jgi:hypothetical protein
MVIAPLVNLATDFIDSLLPGSSSTSAASSTSASSSNTTTAGSAATSNATSPFAQVLSSLQQSDPAEFQAVTQQITGYLNTGAQTATANGYTTLASQLSQLSTDFTNISANGQLPGLG